MATEAPRAPFEMNGRGELSRRLEFASGETEGELSSLVKTSNGSRAAYSLEKGHETGLESYLLKEEKKAYFYRFYRSSDKDGEALILAINARKELVEAALEEYRSRWDPICEPPGFVEFLNRKGMKAKYIGVDGAADPDDVKVIDIAPRMP